MGYIRSILGALSALKEIINVFKLLLRKYNERQERIRLEKIRKALEDNKNQIPIEEAIGSDNAGLPTKRREGVEVEKSE